MKVTQRRLDAIHAMDEHQLHEEHPQIILTKEMFETAAHHAAVWSISWQSLGSNPSFHSTLDRIPVQKKLAFWRECVVYHEIHEARLASGIGGAEIPDHLVQHAY